MTVKMLIQHLLEYPLDTQIALHSISSIHFGQGYRALSDNPAEFLEFARVRAVMSSEMSHKAINETQEEHEAHYANVFTPREDGDETMLLLG